MGQVNVLSWLLNYIPALFLCFLVHEGGHWLAALCFGERIKFRFSFGKFYVPRFVWEMPYMDRWKEKVVAAAGFATEGAVVGILAALGWPWMAGAFLLHFVAYPLYAGEASDFKWFRR